MEKIIICIRTSDHSGAAELSHLGKEAAWEALSYMTAKTREQLIESGIRLEKKESGKPYFYRTEIGVSISHTSRTEKPVAVAAVCAGEIGVDIEEASRESARAAKRMFSQKEQAWLEEQDSPGGFALLWTLRESYAKWSGLGLAKMPAVEFLPEGENLCSGDIRCSEINCSDPYCCAGSILINAENWRISCVLNHRTEWEMEVFLDGKIFF